MTKANKTRTKKIKDANPSRRTLEAKANASYQRISPGDAGKTGVSLRFQDLLLRHGDVQRLQGQNHLNDRLISFYCTYLQSRRYHTEPDLHFLTPAISYSIRLMGIPEGKRLARELQLANKRFIFIPLAEESHWSLLLVSRPDRKFYYFDSEDNRHLNLARLMEQRLRSTLAAEDFVFTPGRCLQQAKNKTYESGIHLLCMTDNLADYVSRCGYATSSLLVSIQEVQEKRDSLIQLIRTLGGKLPGSK